MGGPLSPPGAEGCNERPVLAAQDDHVRVRFVQVVLELGHHLLIHAYLHGDLATSGSEPEPTKRSLESVNSSKNLPPKILGKGRVRHPEYAGGDRTGLQAR